jgi:hypothetical protein
MRGSLRIRLNTGWNTAMLSGEAASNKTRRDARDRAMRSSPR